MRAMVTHRLGRANVLRAAHLNPALAQMQVQEAAAWDTKFTEALSTASDPLHLTTAAIAPRLLVPPLLPVALFVSTLHLSPSGSQSVASAMSTAPHCSRLDVAATCCCAA